MTEDDAKSKWCPFVRAIIMGDDGSFVGPANRAVAAGGEGHQGASCIGSACMAWRWAGYRADTGAWVRKVTDGGEWDPSKADGYCGLAGAIL